MPHNVLPVPLSEDYREPTTIPLTSAQRLIGVYAWQEGLRKVPGMNMLGTAQALDVAPRNFFDCIFPDGTHQLIALAAADLQVWNGTTWGANISGVAARPAIPTPANVRFSVVNTLGYVYIAAGGNSNMLYYNGSFAVVPPADLVSPNWGVAGVTNLTARVVLGFADRLILIRTVEDGVEFPTRIRWNALTNAAGATVPPQNGQFDTTLVGANLREITESTSEPLTGGFVLGERCFLTKAHEILELIPTGQPDPTFSIQSRVSGTGLIAPWSVAVQENYAFFIGTDNIYMFDGNTVQPIGDPILARIASVLASSEEQLKPQAQMYPLRNEYHLLLALVNSVKLVYDYRRQRWYEEDMTAGQLETGSTTIGTVSGMLVPGNFGVQLLVYNGAPTRSRTAFHTAESFASRPEYSTITGGDAITCQIITRQFFPKRKGFRGVVEPAATDKLNVLYEVDFKGASSQSVTVTATDDGGQLATQTVTTDAGGRAKVFFTLPWQCLELTFSSTSTTNFRLSAVIGYRWGEGGFHLPTDPS